MAKNLWRLAAVLAWGALATPLVAAPDKADPAKTAPAKVDVPKADAATADAVKPDAPKSDAAKADKVIDGFVKSIQDNKSLDDAKRQAVLALIQTQRADADRRSTTITDALSTVDADFRASLSALGDEDTAKAVELLKKLVGSSDPYVAAEASFFLARAHLMEDRAEDAAEALKKLTGELADKTLYSAEAQFLLGTAQTRLLDRKPAIASLEKFLKENPDAAERLRVAAFRQLEQLKGLKEGSLGDVQDRMGFSRRKLSLEDSGERTRGEQDKIISMLEVLIKEAEEQEKQGGT
jgi:tetratricopeptide (TPR) repeat protein